LVYCTLGNEDNVFFQKSGATFQKIRIPKNFAVKNSKFACILNRRDAKPEAIMRRNFVSD
jgi:hypothetical protein